MSETIKPKTNDEIVNRLKVWLTGKMPQATDLTLSNIVEPSQGFSSKTILFTVHWQEDGVSQHRDLVARIQRDTLCPMLADIFHQYRVMDVAHKKSSACVPEMIYAEHEATIIGDPFFIMNRVEGRVPSDFPSYHQEGWFAELSDDQRATCWWNGIKEMEKLHRLSWREFPFIAKLVEPPDATFFLNDFVGNWLDWAAMGQPYPELEEALAFLLEHAPPIHQSGLVWNDARLGNTMYKDDLNVAALFDFEVATLGPPELDLAHWLYLDEVFSTQFGIDQISGIPDRKNTIEGFEKIYGWKMPYFSYYEAVVALKIVILTIRDYSNGKTRNEPDALPGFLMERLRQFLDEYRDYLAGY